MKRERSNDGIKSHIEAAVPLRPGLIYSVLGAPAPLERRGPRVFHGPKALSVGSPLPRATDKQVLEMRRLRDHEGKTTAQIVALTGFDKNYVNCVISYRNRVHLDPGPRPAHPRLGA